MKWSDKSSFDFFRSFDPSHGYDIIEKAYWDGNINYKTLHVAAEKIGKNLIKRSFAGWEYNYAHNSMEPLKIIQQLVAAYFELEPDALIKNENDKKINKACNIAVYLCHRLTYCSILAIQQFFGFQNNNEVISISKFIEKERQINEKLAEELDGFKYIARDYHIVKR